MKEKGGRQEKIGRNEEGDATGISSTVSILAMKEAKITNKIIKKQIAIKLLMND